MGKKPCFDLSNIAAYMWIVYFKPDLVAWVTFFDLFLVCIYMGSTAAIPSYDDAFKDVSGVLIVCFLFGLILGLVVYLIVGAIKQEFKALFLRSY